MNRSAVLALAALALAAAAPASAPAQSVSLEVGNGAPRLRVVDVLDDDALEEAVRSGLPLRMRFRLELWRDGFFDALIAEAEWAAVVAFEPLEGQFLAGLLDRDGLGRFPSWAGARTAVERAYPVAMPTPTAGRYYYLGVLEIETLSLSDLDELERWLRGELEPAVQGRRSVGGAVGTGLKRLLIRMLGLPARRFQARSDSFRAP